MKFATTTPPANDLFTSSQLAYHCRLDTDLAADSDEESYLIDLLSAATEYAEEATASSLLTRTITATFYAPDNLNLNRIVLPRGPVQTILSVTNGDGNAITTATLSCQGNSDILTLPNGWIQPLVVVYTAGYGPDPQDCPGDIRQAVRQHVATLYEYRETVTEKSTATVVPHTLADFYARKCRTSGVG
jgi:uncharacterized phiE125 gp8 family phage protein